MCMCGKPTINGQPNAYSWDGKQFSTRHPFPPAVPDGDELLFDEPGRCGGIDAHSHHFRLVKAQYGGFGLLVRHGGGEETVNLGYAVVRQLIPAMREMDSTTRFWLLHTLYTTARDAGELAAGRMEHRWRVAAAEKRIRTRKRRGQNLVEVGIVPAIKPAAQAQV